jgi:hypothetical protein
VPQSDGRTIQRSGMQDAAADLEHPHKVAGPSGADSTRFDPRQ